MQNNTRVYIALGVVLVLLGSGAFVRYQVVKDRNVIPPQVITDFGSCIESQGDLDVTGTVCTTTDGTEYTKPGVVPPAPIIEPDEVNSTSSHSSSTEIALDAPTTFLLGETKTVSNGPSITLVAIHDSRCKPDVQCIWAGEFAADWRIVDGNSTKTITLGTVRNGAETLGSYTYTLGDVNADQATLTVTKITPNDTFGTVTGIVTVGPICPVESIDNPCVIPPEVYTTRSVVVYAANQTTELESHALDATGHYTLSLKPGTYGLQIRPAGIGAGEIKSVTVTSAKTATIDFDIDTGIR